MLGRVAYQNPFLLSKIDEMIFNKSGTIATRLNILEKYKIYAERKVQEGENIKNLTRHIIGLYQGRPGAKKYRQMLSGAIPKNHGHFFEEIIKAVA